MFSCSDSVSACSVYTMLEAEITTSLYLCLAKVSTVSWVFVCELCTLCLFTHVCTWSPRACSASRWSSSVPQLKPQVQIGLCGEAGPRGPRYTPTSFTPLSHPSTPTADFILGTFQHLMFRVSINNIHTIDLVVSSLILAIDLITVIVLWVSINICSKWEAYYTRHTQIANM